MRQLTLMPMLPRRAAPNGPATPLRRKPSAKRTKNRRGTVANRATQWLPRSLRPTLLSALALLVLAGGGLAWGTGGLNALGTAGLDWTASAGIAVREVLVEGRVETKADRILAALEVHRGSPLLAFSPTVARKRLLALGWVKDARVERRFPDVIYVHLEERRPVAIWQQAGRLALVDESDAVIGEDAVPRFPSLPVIVGPDAPEEFAALSAALESRPEMLAHVMAAVRIGGRRWDLRLTNGMTVLLPERNVATAWQVLADAVRDRALLERDIAHIDLRLPDRLVLRLSPGAAPGREGEKGA
jgi:cell division protein FtsQ